MRKAFTMLELVFVLVIIGIIAVVALREAKTNPLREAAIQIISHIRYTQHLAMVDDRYDANNFDSVGALKWYKERWRFAFSRGIDTNNRWSYTIFADTIGDSTGNPDATEIAVNPLDSSKRLTGGFSGVGYIHTGDAAATDKMNIGESYGVSNVTFSAPCRTSATSKSLGFDHLGRPLRGALSNYISAYDSGTVVANILVLGQCVITLTHDDGKTIQIAIEPETGYTHILEI